MKWYNFRNGGKVPVRGYASGGIVDNYSYGDSFGADAATAQVDGVPLYVGDASSQSVGGGPQRNTAEQAANTPFNPTENYFVPGVAEHIAANANQYDVIEKEVDGGGEGIFDFGDANAVGVAGGYGLVDTPDPATLNVVDDGVYALGESGAAPVAHFNNIEEANAAGYGSGAFDAGGGNAAVVNAAAGGVPQPTGVGSYLAGPSTPGVNTGIPQGGYARNAINAYLSGANAQQYNQGISDQVSAPVGWGGVDQDALAESVSNYAALSDAAAAPVGGGNDEVDLTGGAGTLETLGGNELTYDNEFEAGLAEDIAANIAAGGLNENGDPFVSSGPNVLSAADEGLFGYGSDYNEEFVENYDANAAHAGLTGTDSDGNNVWDPNAPIGATTGTPLYDQGYVGLGVDPLGDAIGGAINNSTIGLLGEAITGNSLMADIDSLLPPEESFSNYNSNDNDDGPSHDVNNDGISTNDTGNAGWGFTSITDMFDGGGPGSSGDSYTGGVWGGSTVGDTSVGVSSIVTGSSDDGGGGGGSDSGGGGGGGYGCYVATALNDGGYWADVKKLRLLAWCMKAKPEGSLDTKLWRNGYCWFGKTVIAPRVDNKVIRWLSDGFYESTVGRKTSLKSLLGKAFFYVPSYTMGLWKLATGKLVEIERT